MLVAGSPSSIRTRRAGDIAGLDELIGRARPSDRYPPHWPAGSTSLVDGDPDAAAWVCVDADDQAIGHVALRQPAVPAVLDAACTGTQPTAFVEVTRLFVAPDHRGRAIGPRLLALAAQYGRGQGLRPFLNVWMELTATLAFYEAVGWQRAGEATIDFGPRSCSQRCLHGGHAIQVVVYSGPERPG